MAAWLLLAAAGLFEIGFALSLKASHGFTRIGPTLLFLVFGAISFGLLNLALRSLPVGTAYAVWTGIGAAGTAILGILFLEEPAHAARIGSIALIILGVIGLRLAGSH